MYPEVKPDQLSILCEVPLQVKIGDKDIEVHPLTLKKMKMLGPSITSIFDKVLGMQDKVKGDINQVALLRLVIDNLPNIMDEVLKTVQIILRKKSGDGDLMETEYLEENLDTVTLGTILGFIIKTSNLQETAKNVVILRGMAK